MGKERRDIPGILRRFIKLFCKGELQEEILGDLYEYHEELQDVPRFKRFLYLFVHVTSFMRPFALKKIKGHTNSNIGMFRNFYFTAIRNLLKYRSYFVINISGLAIGIASFTFISLYIVNELSYDRFHSKHENIYRVSNEAVIRGEPNKSATTSGPMAGVLLADYPEVIQSTRIHKSNSLLVGKGARKINEDDVLFADSTFFDVFDFELIKGNPKTALVHPRSMILTESYAKKYFGDEDPYGRQLTVDDDSIFYTITGIASDVPANSHIQFNMLGSMTSNPRWNSTHWVGSSKHTYVVLREDTDLAGLQVRMKDIFYKFMAKEIEYYTGLKITEWEGAGNRVDFKLTPIADIHLKSEATGELEPAGNISYIYIYGLIGIIILFIAIFNFVNLATAHSATRAKEVGVRKVIGSTKSNLVLQFILESILVAFVATLLGSLLVILLKPNFVDLIGKGLAYDLTSSYLIWLVMFGFAVLVGVLAGFYPSFVLSAYKPAEVLKGTYKTKGKAGWLRNLLVTVQFSASIIIIIGTLVVYNQIEFMLGKNLGFDKDQVLVIKRPDWLGNNIQVFKNELIKNPNIKVVSNSQTFPGKDYEIRSYRKVENPETFLLLNNQVSYEHAELMGLELVSGRFFSKEFGLDSNAVVINESAAAKFGFEDPVGKNLTSAFKKDRLLTIIGVVKDYNIETLHKQVVPVSLELDENINSGYVGVKMTNTHNLLATLEFIEDTWIEHAKGKPMQYFFFNDDYEKLYQSETNTANVLLVFAGLSILIACMGLIGLITYTANIKRKEIGIRKVLGAGTGSLIKLLSTQTIRLIVIATVISWPLAYLGSNYWLENFANRINVDPSIYFGATMIVLAIVGFAISFQTIKAATSNPVESLRDE